VSRDRCGSALGRAPWLSVFLVALPALALLAAPGAASAANETAKKAARPHYEKGASEYNLGHFLDSIGEFEKAYELDPAPILLFNIAQAHRQNGNNERAAFFYRRYLEQAPNAANRPEVEKRIKDLDEVIKQQADVKRRPPTEVTDQERERTPDATSPPAAAPPGTPATAVVVAGTPAATAPATPPPDAGVAAASSQAASELGRRVRLRASAGPAFPKYAGRDLGGASTIVAIRVGGEYVFDLGGPGFVDVGLSAAYAPLQYHTTDTPGSNQSAAFWGVLATGTYRYRLTEAFELSGELGVGIVWWSGLGANNPFTVDGSGANGAVPMPSLMLGVAAIYRLPRRLFVFAEPAYLFSKTTSDGLSSAVSSVSRFDIALGVGYSL
jgi:hypothetical protein